MANETYEPEYLRLVDDTGAESVYEILDVLPFEGDEYAVLFPTEEGADGAVILRILPAEDGGEEQYTGVDEATMNAVFAAFRARHREELGE